MKKLITIPVLLILVSLFVNGLSLSDSQGTINTNLGETGTVDFTLTNNDNINYTNIVLSYEIADFRDDLNNIVSIDFNDGFALDNGTSQIVTISATPEEDQYLGEYTGTITISATEQGTSNVVISTYSLTVDARSKYFSIEIDDYDDLEELQPGDSFDLVLDIRNIWNVDLKDVEARIWIMDIDDGDNIDEKTGKEDIDSLDSNDDDFSVEFQVPLNVDEDNFDVMVRVEGEDDETGDNYQVTKIFKNAVEVTKDEDEEVQFDNINMPSSTLTCGSTFTVSVDAINTGADDLDDMYFKLEIEGTSYSLLSEDYDLDSGDYDDREQNIDFLVTLPNDLTKKTYNLKILAYNEDNDIVGGEYQQIIVQSCGVDEEEQEETQEEEQQDTNTNTNNDNTIYLPTGFATGTIFTSENLSLVFWGIGIVALIVIIVYFLVILFRRK